MRSPGDIKSLLLQAASQSGTWGAFIKKAEDAAWVAFPERIINEIAREESGEAIEANYPRKLNAKKYCRLHGEGFHMTKECDIVKLVESRGWIRKTISQASNKKDSDYLNVIISSTGENGKGFLNRAIFHDVNRYFLFDTGAGISLIHSD